MGETAGGTYNIYSNILIDINFVSLYLGRFLQGPGTDPRAVDMIRQGVIEGRDVSVCLLNYKADGTPFWNQFFVAALRDAEGAIVNHIGVQCEVDNVSVASMKERVKKLPIPIV